MNTYIENGKDAPGMSFNTENLCKNPENIYLLPKGKYRSKRCMTIDSDSFRTIYDLYYYDLCRFLNYYTRDICAIEEIVQDLFTSLWEERAKIEIEYIKTYLYKGARNRMLNFLRDDSNRKDLMGQWAKSVYENREATDCIDRDKFRSTLKAAVDILPEKCKEIFLLSREHKLSYKEIAQVKSISVKTVENQMGIAFRKIRDYFSAHFDESA